MNGIRTLVFIILTGYFLLVGRVLFYKNGSIDRQTFFKERVINVVPFSGTYSTIWLAHEHGGEHIHRALWLIGGNLLLLLPWGFLAPVVLVSWRHIQPIALSGFLLSLSAELVQLIFRIGVFETDDILLNTTGTVLGYYLFRQLAAGIRDISLPGKKPPESC
jgi:glycopeptide antibiotics resistance protein